MGHLCGVGSLKNKSERNAVAGWIAAFLFYTAARKEEIWAYDVGTQCGISTGAEVCSKECGSKF